MKKRICLDCGKVVLVSDNDGRKGRILCGDCFMRRVVVKGK